MTPAHAGVITKKYPLLFPLCNIRQSKWYLTELTIIIAENDEIWEEIEIDKGFLNETVPLLKGKDDYLYKELLKWDDLDFSNAVEVHNYVWEKLGGIVGKAIAINEDAVQALKERLSQ